MKVIFTGRHVEVSESLRTFAEERFLKMTPYLDDIIDVHVTLSVEKHRHLAEVSVKTRGGDFLPAWKQMTCTRAFPRPSISSRPRPTNMPGNNKPV